MKSDLGASGPLKVERELVRVLLYHLPEPLADVATVASEVTSHGRSRTDVVLFTGEEVIGIEAKIADWPSVLAQAFLNRYCYDYSYVAIPASIVRDTRLTEARRHGIGVISVATDGLKLACEARRLRPVAALRNNILATQPAGAEP